MIMAGSLPVPPPTGKPKPLDQVREQVRPRVNPRICAKIVGSVTGIASPPVCRPSTWEARQDNSHADLAGHGRAVIPGLLH